MVVFVASPVVARREISSLSPVCVREKKKKEKRKRLLVVICKLTENEPTGMGGRMQVLLRREISSLSPVCVRDKKKKKK